MMAGFVGGRIVRAQQNQGAIPGALFSTSANPQVFANANADGYFLVMHPPGTFYMAAWYYGFQCQIKGPIEVPEGGFVEVDFELEE